MDIPRYRIGNDLTVLWAICNNDGTPFDLSGKVVRLFVTNDKGITEVKPTITSDKDGSANNVILWNYLGDDQKVLGKHTLTVEILTSDDKRKIKRDVCDAFTLVSRSESEETGGDANFMDSGSIYLSTKLDVYRFGNVRVDIGTNGNWFIDGYDTGKTALGGGPGLVNIIYKESDLGGEFQPDSVIDTFNANAINAIYKALKAISLKDINNISLANLAAYDVLTYNGSNWINLPFKDLINLFRGPSESGSDTPVSGDSYWILGEDGKLYSNYDIYVRGNAVIEGDTSSGGSGQDTPAAGGSLSNLRDVSLSSLSEGDVLVYDKDNGVWYNVPQSKIVPNLEGYAKQTWVTEHFLKSDSLDAYKEELGKEVKEIADLLNSMWRIEDNKIVTDMDVLVKANLIVEGDTSSGGEGQDTPAEGTVTGIEVNGTPYEPNTQGVIDLSDAFNAIDVSDQLKDYYTQTQTDSAISTAIANLINGAPTTLDTLKEIADALAENEDVVDALEEAIGKKADNTTVTALAERVSANEGAIDDNAGNIKKNSDAIDALDKRVTDEEAVTTTYKTWWADLKKYIKVEGSNVKIDTNLIVAGDTSSGGSGQDTPASGTVTGIKVGPTSTDILTPNNAGIIDMVSVLSSIDVSDQLTAYAKTEDVNAALLTKQDTISDLATIRSGAALGATALQRITKTMVDSVLGSTTAGNANRFLMSTGSTSVWASITKDMVTDALGYTPANNASLANYLPLSGGTIKNQNIDILTINRNGGGSVSSIAFKGSDALFYGYLGFDAVDNPVWMDSAYNRFPLIHSGNIGSYALKTDGSNSMTAGKGISWGKSTSATWNHFSLNAGKGIQILNTVGNPSEGAVSDYAVGLAVSGYYGFCLGYDALMNTCVFKGSNSNFGDWKTIAFTDSDITGNAATASLASKAVQLCTNPSGLAYAYASETGSFMTLGRNNYAAYLDGSMVTLRYGSSLTQGLILNSSGNVTIGGSDLAGTNAKLYVAGASAFANNRVVIPINGDRITFNASSGYTMGVLAMNTVNTYLEAPLATNSSTGAKTPIMIGWRDGTYPFFISTSANVGIGNTSPAYKLHVNGTTRASAFYSTSIGIECDANGNTSGYGSEINRFGANLYLQSREGDLYLSHSAGTTYIRGLASITGAVTMSSTLSVTRDSYYKGNAFFGAGKEGIYISSSGQSIVWHNSSNTYVTMLMSFTSSSILAYQDLCPDANNSLTLGTSSYQWSTIYGVNGVFSGDTSSGSDIRFKDIIKNKTLKIEHIAKAPLFTFKWNDRDDDTIHLGSSAQYWEKVTPWLVKGEDFKTLDYATLGVAMGISLAKKAVNHEERIKVLEKENKALKEEIRRMQYGS